MIAEMRGVVPNYSALLARIHLQDAWSDIRKTRGWSWQFTQGGFSTPPKINTGTATVTWGSPNVTMDSTATTAINTYGTQYGSLITQRQFRVGASSIYNIIEWNSGTSTITLDRPWADVTAPQQNPPPQTSTLGYTIYQCYYPAPVKPFLAWEAIMDVVNVIWLNTSPTKSERERINRADPQRQIFANPGTVLSIGTDLRLGSSTFGWMLFELYPQPQAMYSYQTWYTYSGPELVNPSDILPHPISESTLKTLARVKAYEWAEANRDTNNPRGKEADYRFLIGAASKEYEDSIHECRMLDRDLLDAWKATMTRLSGLGPVATFDPSTGTVMSRNM